MAKLRQDHPHLTRIVTADRLSSHAPQITPLHDHDLRSILGGKEGDHASLFQQGQAAERAGRVTLDEQHNHTTGVVHRCRFVNDLPLNASPPDLRINCIEYWAMGATKVPHFS